MRYLVMLITLLIISYGAQAADFCEYALTNTIKKLYPESYDFGDFIDLNKSPARYANLSDYNQCKVWPAFPNIGIVMFSTHEGSDESDPLMDLELALVDIESGKMLAHYVDENAAYTDRNSLYSINLDTAYYKLNDSTVGFGVRFIKSDSAGGMQHFGGTNLSLYTYQNSEISKVINTLEVKSHNTELGIGCTITKEEISSVIIVGGQSTNGFNNLIVKSQQNDYEQLSTDSGLEDGERICKEVRNENSYFQDTLVFNGHSYDIPQRIKGFSY